MSASGINSRGSISNTHNNFGIAKSKIPKSAIPAKEKSQNAYANKRKLPPQKIDPKLELFEMQILSACTPS